MKFGASRCAVLACALALAGAFSLGTAVAERAESNDAAAIRALIDQARWSDADAAARSLLASREAKEGPDSLECAQAIDLLVEILTRDGRWTEPEARELATRAVAVKEARLGPDSLELATSLLNLGVIQMRAGPVLEARTTLEKALRMREKALGPAHLLVAEALSQVGWAASTAGDVPAAITANERALAIREAALGPDDLIVADSLTNLGGAVHNSGDFAKAIALHDRALRIRRRSLPAGHPDVAQSILALAEAMHQNGDLAAALPLFEEAKRLREGAATPDPFRLSEVLIDMADLLLDLGDLEAARPLYERAHRMRSETAGEHSWLVGLSHQSFAVFLDRAGERTEARAHFESAVAIWDETFPPGHPLRAVGRQSLGILLRRMGDLPAARRVLQEAIDIWQAGPLPNHPFRGEACAALGGVLRDLGDAAGSRPMLERALEILRVSLGPDHPNYAEALLERARLSWMEGKQVAALDDALQAEGILRASLRSATKGLSEGEALRYQDIMSSGLDLAFSILEAARPGTLKPGAPSAVFEALVRSRALVLDEMAARHRGIVRTDDAAVGHLADALDQARRKYARLLVTGPSPQLPGAYSALLTGARFDMERAERALAGASRAFVAQQERLNLTRDTVSRALPPGTALVSFAAYRRCNRLAPARPGVPAYLAMVLRPGGGAPIAVPLGQADPIEAGIERWRLKVSAAPHDAQADAAYRAAAQSIRQAVWDPVARRLGGATRVLVVPDGAIHAISLATLVDGAGRFLLESGPTIHYLSAERDLLGATGTPSKGHGLLVLGGADFNAPPQSIASAAPAARPSTGPVGTDRPLVPRGGEMSSCSDWAALRFTPLPGSEAEAEQVRALWMQRRADQPDGGDPIVMLSGPEASEANLRAAASGKRVLHLATHAFSVPSRCDGAAPSEGAIAVPGESPAGRMKAGTALRVSGLALSGANLRSQPPSGAGFEDDGLLTGEEIASLDLSDVEWVVLSGCQTGIGLARAGEGILGLRRSFQVAGARTLVLSLWPVSDNDTRDWMAALYGQRARGKSTADAIRESSLQIVRGRRQAGVTAHPFFWGAFVAAGDWR
jgi:tetratricopeptide (TPR) repeat protein/CHAT domain-containing protein